MCSAQCTVCAVCAVSAVRAVCSVRVCRCVRVVPCVCAAMCVPTQCGGWLCVCHRRRSQVRALTVACVNIVCECGWVVWLGVCGWVLCGWVRVRDVGDLGIFRVPPHTRPRGGLNHHQSSVCHLAFEGIVAISHARHIARRAHTTHHFGLSSLSGLSTRHTPRAPSLSPKCRRR